MDSNTVGAVRRRRRAIRPINTVLPAITGTLQNGQTLTCSTGTWGNTPISYKYEWVGAGVATGNTYVVAAGDVGKRVSCRVTANNAAGPGRATVVSGLIT